MQDLRIAAVQMNCRVAERDRNLATIERFVEEAAALAESRRETLMFFRHYRRPEMYRRWENEIR